MECKRKGACGVLSDLLSIKSNVPAGCSLPAVLSHRREFLLYNYNYIVIMI